MGPRRWFRAIACAVACVPALAGIAALAPGAAGLAPPAVAAQQEPAPRDDDIPTIRVDIDVVNLQVSVKDRKGGLITTLDKTDFEIYEDDERQQVRYFSRETDLPLTVGLLIDSSVSQHRLIAAEREAGEMFFRRVLGPKDLAFLISFDTDVDLLQDFTSNITLLRRALDDVRVNAPAAPVAIPSAQGPFPSIQTGGTHLYDAIYLAAREKLGAEVGRKAVVVITDGVDAGSRVEWKEAIEAGHRADVIVYGIVFFDRQFYGRFGFAPQGELKKIAEETGGRVIEIDRDKDLPAAFEAISRELRSQYSIGYISTNAARDGRFRQVKVKTVRGGLRVQARKGYYAPLASGSAAP